MLREERPVDDILQLTQVLTGARLDATGTAARVQPATIQDTWTKLSGQYPAQWQQSPLPDDAWRWQEIQESHGPDEVLLNWTP